MTPGPWRAEGQTRCWICGRTLNLDRDPLSGDCGGDCWGCVGWIEARTDRDVSTRYIQPEIEAGWRDADGSPKPQAALTMSHREASPACPLDLEEAIGFLRAQGWSKMETIRWIRASRGSTLLSAKTAVHASHHWSDRRAGDDAFHEELENMIRRQDDR